MCVCFLYFFRYIKYNEKKALLIEITYNDTKYKTTNEVSIEGIGKILKEKFLYDDLTFLKENESEVHKPTRENIVSNIKKLSDESNGCDEIWIHYMGHSTVMVDERNEYCQRGIVPIDYEENGFIFDDELKSLFFSFKCKLYLFLDCCYGNYGFNIGHSMKVIEGRYIKEDNTTMYKYPENNNTIYVISMYLGALKNKKTQEQKEISNLL